MTEPKTLSILAAAALLAGCQQAGNDQGNQAAATPATAEGSASSGGAPEAPAATIGAIISRSTDHSTLVQALNGAGLARTLEGAGPYTVFAPTDAAFAKLPAETGGQLMRPERKAALTGILTYHVVPGVVTAKDLGAAIERGGGKTELATMYGGTLTAAQANGGIVITDSQGSQARVTGAEQLASNGVVHVIDGVLKPQLPK